MLAFHHLCPTEVLHAAVLKPVATQPTLATTAVFATLPLPCTHAFLRDLVISRDKIPFY
jgi:hypothetical protein